jgi:hypothetical protein
VTARQIAVDIISLCSVHDNRWRTTQVACQDVPYWDLQYPTLKWFASLPEGALAPHWPLFHMHRSRAGGSQIVDLECDDT